MSIFEQAARLRLRFASPKGELSVEDLFDLPLTSSTGKANLDDVARAIHKTLKSDDHVSFVESATKPDETMQLRFDIVKHVIAVKVAERDAAKLAKEKAEKRQAIMTILHEKEHAALKDMPMDKLRELLAGL